MKKLPQITILYWVMKICATTLGETGADLFSMTLKIGYTVSSIIFFGIFLTALTVQLFTKKHNPFVYWMVFLSTSIVGTTMSDYIDRTLGLGYALGSLLLVGMLILILIFWKLTESSLSVTHIKTRKGEILYWLAFLIANTLGTALGDFIADSSGLGFAGGALLISALLILLVLLHYFTKTSPVALFWLAFVLTRPFGATFGDLLTKPLSSGGLNLGTLGSSVVLFGILLVLVSYSYLRKDKMLFTAD